MSVENPQDRHFRRRLKAAVEGLHLPSEEELLRGMNFFRGELGEDIREYAERLWRRVRKRGDVAFASLAAALEELTVEQSDDGVRSLMRALDGVEEVKGVPIEACRLRCQFYLASSGDSDAAASIAGEAAVVALRDINNRDDLGMAGRALSWAVMACSLAQAAKVDNLYASRRSLSRMGGDLDTIVATAPKPTALASKDNLRSFLHTLPDAVLRDLAENGIEDIARKGTP